MKWDEEKFFRDFKEESDKVMPDPEFVQELKKMPEIVAKKSKTDSPMRKNMSFGNSAVRNAAIAAALLLCVFAGGAASWMVHGLPSKSGAMQEETASGTAGSPNQIQAGADTAQSQIHAGKKDPDISSGTIGDEKAADSKEYSELSRAIAFVQDENSTVERVAADGSVESVLSSAERETLLGLLEHAEEADISIDADDEHDTYFCGNGEEVIEIRVYQETYFMILDENSNPDDSQAPKVFSLSLILPHIR